ncbi:hypothetical protein MCOR27_008188 [Pyricularia oryzae]|uniref:Uncharacterized protein n=1 Tax=Pyricularia grisea TaxID=148305 RepID=A0ABQ8NXS0_PYRGI|nr:hypothetical protein MCOR01_003607 [Pyricularia oryzae]KAI6303641.1 hypothetical protein MCOR33_001164 [Pyricularia grisea]KAI6255338.1 hypothetical protein MCOR19_008152 [Pyricularia oryzae]KAI6271983.1 hypothetical protein MCOR26_007581 [Pyricularia oryzae]KAI6272775.1 hypothetical protein MCOR27_008188 [Pyricularia oryzae]
MVAGQTISKITTKIMNKDYTGRMERLRSSSPSNSAPGRRRSQGSPMTSQNPKRHLSEAPQVSRSVPKKRRLVSITPDDLQSTARNSRGPSQAASQDIATDLIHHQLPEDDGGAFDDFLDLQHDASSPDFEPPPVQQLSQQHKTPMSIVTSSAMQSALLATGVGQKVASLGAQLVTNPPQSAAPGPEAAEAAAQVEQLQNEYRTVEAKLQLARTRLSEQLNVFDGPGGLSTTTTPASLRPSSTMPISIHVNEDDAVASALSHIASLESRRSGLLSRIHAAQAAELEAKQHRDSRQLTVQVENARLFRRLMDLGPAGTASLLRVLLKAAGIDSTDGGKSSDVMEATERRIYIRRELEEDLAREGLLPAAKETPPLNGT